MTPLGFWGGSQYTDRESVNGSARGGSTSSGAEKSGKTGKKEYSDALQKCETSDHLNTSMINTLPRAPQAQHKHLTSSVNI